LTQFALLLAAAVVLHAVEGLFPPPAPIPGAKLGLANIATLICLATLGLRATLALTAARTVLSSVIAGGLLGFGFLLSFGAGMTSALAMGLVKLAGKDRFSLVGLSLAGAVAHNLAQLGLAALVIRHAGIIVYLPYMLLGSLPTGVLTGAAALYALRARGAALGKWLTPGRRR
jgi:heptaprenyl diphosphate synthase